MKDPRNIVLKPIVSEKSYSQIEQNKYTFKVALDARKVEIAQAVAEIFGVHVTSVNTMRMTGKRRRQGYTQGRRPNWKKAIVSLKAGEKIEIFEGK